MRQEADPETNSSLFGAVRKADVRLDVAAGRAVAMSEPDSHGIGRRFKRYREYRDSGSEWIGTIPSHWEVCALRRKLFRSPNSIKIGPFGSQLKMESMVASGFKVYGQEHVISQDFNLGLKYVDERKFSDLSACEIKPGDLVVTMMGSSGRSAVVPDGIESGIMDSHLLRVRVPKDEVTPSFVALAIDQASYIKAQIDALGKGAIMQGLNSGLIKNLVLAIPPVPEQDEILSFLDRETAKIDALVAKRERLIELLEEKRAALITQVVTKGLDLTVPFRDSGVEWLGEIPAHWEVKKLKAVSSLQTGIALGKKYDSMALEARPYLRVANVQDGYLELEEMTQIDLPPRDIPRYELRSGDVVVTEGGDFDKLGRGYVWEGQVPGCLHQNHIFAIRPNGRRLHPQFLSAVMASFYGRAYFTATSIQSTNLASTNSSKIRQFQVPLPKLEEQGSILEFMAAQTEGIDLLLRRIELSIERLKELRGTLISAAVTGQIDVREEVA